MAHDTGDADIGDEHYEVPSEGIQAGGRDLRSKTDPLGRDIDNFLRNLFGGEGVGGQPTPNLGIMPQAPALGSAASGIPTGINAAVRADPGGTVGQQVPAAPIPDIPSSFGQGVDLTGSVGAMDVGEEFDPGSVTSQRQEGDVAGLGVGPAVPMGRGEQPLDPNAQSEAIDALMLMLSPLGATAGAAAPVAMGARGSAQGANPFFQAIRNFLGIGRGPKVPPGRQLVRPQGQGAPTYTPSVIRQPPPTGTQGELFGTMG